MLISVWWNIRRVQQWSYQPTFHRQRSQTSSCLHISWSKSDGAETPYRYCKIGGYWLILRRREPIELFLMSGNSIPYLNITHFPVGDMVRSMEGIIFSTALGLNMGYYHTKIDTNFQRLFTIEFHWVKYKSSRLPMCIKIVPGIFSKCRM
jgi:hypothetical protein